MKKVRILACSLVLAAGVAQSNESLQPLRDQAGWLERICQSPDDWSSPPTPGWQELPSEVVRFRGREIGERRQWRQPGEGMVRVDRLTPTGRPGRWILEYHNRNEQPLHFVGLDDQCRLRAVRRLIYRNDQAASLEVMDNRFELVAEEWLNPEMPVSSDKGSPGSVVVAMVDSGVNYRLPAIHDGLAADAHGRPIGYDFWDLDESPFDAHFTASPFFVQRHGTRTASIVLAEAPVASLVSYRYPRPAMDRMADLVRHAAGLGVRIVGLPLGSNRLEDWTAFEEAAKRQPGMLFIASAGNNGRDIDREPVYPAALTLPNLLVVTSSDETLGPAQGSNFGSEAVDYLLPAERIEALDFDGRPRAVSGSSYAVSRLVAMAARLLARQPAMDSVMLKAAIAARSLPVRSPGDAGVGVIPDPLADSARMQWKPLATLADLTEGAATGDSIPLRILLLDPAWDAETVHQALSAATELLGRCKISFHAVQTLSFDGSDYLRDLDAGAARTLLQSLPGEKNDVIDMVFARDSRMAMVYDGQAFGIANTSARPWLRNSAWFLPGTQHLPLVIAHELFHVLSNNGSHAPGESNLMAAEIGPETTVLTPAQCALARSYRQRGSS